MSLPSPPMSVVSAALPLPPGFTLNLSSPLPPIATKLSKVPPLENRSFPPRPSMVMVGKPVSESDSEAR
jgi:hypothetical protein